MGRKSHRGWRVPGDVRAALSPQQEEGGKQAAGLSAACKSRTAQTARAASSVATEENSLWPSWCGTPLVAVVFAQGTSPNPSPQKTTSLCAWPKETLGKDQGENNQSLVPTNILVFGNSTGRRALGFPRGFCPIKITPKIPNGFCYTVGFCELQTSLLAGPELGVLPLKPHEDVGGSFRTLLPSS